jgi:hypothetical protein
VKKFYGANLSIYRGEGGSFTKPPQYDRCEFSGRRRSEGDVFYQNSKVFVETDRWSQPASPRG